MDVDDIVFATPAAPARTSDTFPVRVRLGVQSHLFFERAFLFIPSVRHKVPFEADGEEAGVVKLATFVMGLNVLGARL